MYADEEAERLQIRPAQVRPHASTLERRAERAFLAGVAEAGELHVDPRGPNRSSAWPIACAPPIGTIETPSASRSRPATRGERLEGQLIADPLDEDHGVHLSISRNAGLTKP